LAGLVVDDLDDLDKAERRPEPAQRRLLVGGRPRPWPGRLPPGRLVPSGAEMEVGPAILLFDLVDLALTLSSL
jgi:hypothetical protein